jgi:hypothetical protein
LGGREGIKKCVKREKRGSSYRRGGGSPKEGGASPSEKILHLFMVVRASPAVALYLRAVKR